MNKAQKAALLSAFTAAAVIFSYVEFLLPVPIIPIANFKLGFSNMAILAVLYLYTPKDAFAVMAARTVLNALLFSGIIPLAMSLTGGILSLTVMSLLKRTQKFSIVGVSVAGATAHNIGQCIAAAMIVQTVSIVAYLPIMMVLSVVCGVLISVASGFIIKIIKNG